MAKRTTTKKATKPKTAPEPKSELVIFDCEQGTSEWFDCRLGIPTASNFAAIMATGRNGDESLMRANLLHRLAGEQITGVVGEEEYRSFAMNRGKALEDEARESYCRRKDAVAKRVGFGRNFSGLKLCGASPDALLGFDGGLEIKTMRPDLLIPLLSRPTLTMPQHKAQVQGNMLVFEREWWDLTIYAGAKMPAADIRIYRDDSYINDLHNQIQIFNHDLKKLVERLRNMRAAG